MNLGRHINALLKKHEAVSVKGLGTFRRIHQSASYDAKRKMVLPPINFIEFDYDAEEGYDFVLYVQQVRQVERAQAEEWLAQQVADLTANIKRDGQVTLDELGYLVSYGHAYIFKPLDLSGFQYVPLEDPYYKPQEEIQPSELPLPAVKEEAEVNMVEDVESSNVDEAKKENLQEKKEETKGVNPSPLMEETYEEPRKGKGLVYAIIAVLALISLGALYYYKAVFSKLEHVEEQILFDDFFIAEETNNDADTLISLESDTTVENQIDTLVHTPSIEQDEQKEKEYKYAIVIGTHPKLEKAQEEAAEYNRKGYKSVRVLTPNLDKNLKKVIWDTYPTKELRDSALRYVQKNVKADAWPLVIK